MIRVVVFQTLPSCELYREVSVHDFKQKWNTVGYEKFREVAILGRRKVAIKGVCEEIARRSVNFQGSMLAIYMQLFSSQLLFSKIVMKFEKM